MGLRLSLQAVGVPSRSLWQRLRLQAKRTDSSEGLQSGVTLDP